MSIGLVTLIVAVGGRLAAASATKAVRAESRVVACIYSAGPGVCKIKVLLKGRRARMSDTLQRYASVTHYRPRPRRPALLHDGLV